MDIERAMEKEEAILADRHGNYEISTEEYYDALSQLHSEGETQQKED